MFGSEVIRLLALLLICQSQRATSDGVQNSDLDETDLDDIAVTELINALQENLEEEEVQDMDFDYAYPNVQDSASQKRAYLKFLYDHVPEQMLERRAGSGRVKHSEEPCDDETEHFESPPKMFDSQNRKVGSLPGKPGINYPNYQEIPLTSFSCAGRRTNAFYADLETDCQVFHVCYPYRRESFLCPVGTTFNQPILACDYWYNSNCSASPGYYEEEEVVTKPPKVDIDDIITIIESISTPAPTHKPTVKPVHPTKPPHTRPTKKPKFPHDPIAVSSFTKFMPIQVQITKSETPAVLDPLIVSALKSQFVPTAVSSHTVEPEPLYPEVKSQLASLVLASKAKAALPLVKPLALKAGAAKIIAKKKVAKLALPALPILAKKHLIATIFKLLTAHQAAPYGTVYHY